GVPAMAAYTTSKFGLLGLSEVLRTELERFGIGVTAVCPGVIKTGIYDSTKLKGFTREAANTIGRMGITPERAAKKIVRAVRKNRAVLMTDLAKVIYNIKRVSPALSRQLNRMIFKQMLKGKENSGL
ncbi:MAG: SDR family NAD(P)-dependent oxidoreductase, partial [Deltaproteobacteria bacterium]